MDKYNFDVKEMVDIFSLEDFILSKDNRIEKEAFLLITDNQYILGYSKGLGFGDYNEAISNSIKDIYGLKDFSYRREIDNISDIIKGNFITAKLVNSEKRGISILFNIDECDKISENQMELFKEFYNKYNDIIKVYSNNFGYPFVRYYLPNKKEYVNDYGIVETETCYESFDLTEIKNILESRVDQNRVVAQEERIIGETINKYSKVKENNYVI